MVTSFCVTGCDQIKEDAVGVAYARFREKSNAYRIRLETLKVIHLEDFDVDERIILKLILRN
jgi:hypothetical protein